MPNVATWWCGQPAERNLVENDLDNRVIAPAFNGPGPDGTSSRPRLMADLSSQERAAFLSRFSDRPGDFVGQEVVQLSTTPVLRDGRLEPAPFVLAGLRRGHAERHPHHAGRVLPHLGPARCPGHLHGEGARTSDVWVIADKPVERVTLLAEHGTT